MASKNRSGRPKILTDRENSLISREVMKNPFVTSCELSNIIESDIKKQISASGIRRILLKNKLKSYISQKKPLITKSMAKKRLAWCKKYKNKEISFWENVIFSDETMITIRNDSLMQRCRRFPWSNPFNTKYIRPTVKYPLSIMMWGCFSKHHRPELTIIEGIMNSEKYEEVLENNIKPIFSENSSLFFQDDSAPCHRSRKIKLYKTNNNIYSLDWPGNSPDLNPIENLWHILKRKVGRFQYKNKKQLVFMAKKIWNQNIDNDVIKNLIESMPKRIDLCIKNNGSITKY